MRLACVRFETFLALFAQLTPAFLDWAGRWRARATFCCAASSVPAYLQRDYLLRRFRSVYSGFAAIRRLCRTRPEVRRTLFGIDYRLMLLPALMALIGRANWWLPTFGSRRWGEPA